MERYDNAAKLSKQEKDLNMSRTEKKTCDACLECQSIHEHDNQIK